jgi:hypothetical protein
MERKYKEFIINGLYGLIVASPSSLKSSLTENFERKFGFPPDSITVLSSNRFTSEGLYGDWIGSMSVSLVLNGEEYTLNRDWAEEYEVDKNHPDFGSKKRKELLENLD